MTGHYMPILAKVQQDNAAYWAEKARVYRLDYHAALARGHVHLAATFKGLALSSQDFAAYESHAARYHVGQTLDHPI